MVIQPLLGVIFHSLVPLFNPITQKYRGQLQFTEVFLMSLSSLLSILLFMFSLYFFATFLHAELTLHTKLYSFFFFLHYTAEAFV